MTLTLLEYYFLLFFIASFLGWCMEVTCKLFQFHRFINRGFMIGPYCPIYGFGAAGVTMLLSRFTEDPFAVFGLAILICGTLEYVVSVMMEKLFHARWWDYSTKRFNLNGRICANTLIPFGLLGLIMVYWGKPTLFGLFALLSESALEIICISLLALMMIDCAVSTWALIRIRMGAENVEGDSTETITAAVRTLLQRESILVRRTLHAFPDARIYNRRLLTRLKKLKVAQKLEEKHEAALRRLKYIRGDGDGK